ncbi:MAG: hypothetical protein NTW21_31320 [Verrucomicrobia bacterium]|nr:hypothetical protein [Verrucomicrobiota bacterium]
MNPTPECELLAGLGTPGLAPAADRAAPPCAAAPPGHGRLFELASAGVLAVSVPELIVVLALAVVVTAGLGLLIAEGVRAWRTRRDFEKLRRAYRQADTSHEKVRQGLKTMAHVVPQLEDSRPVMSAHGVELLDRHAVSMMALQRVKRVPYGRTRSRRVATRQLLELASLHTTFERFQQAVLVALYQQSVARVVMPPVSVRRYRAAFTVLEHDLPEVLWPLMNRILEQHVELWVGNVSGVWHQVRGLGFRRGKEVVFSRSHLEAALDLRLTVRHPDGRSFTNEFVVEHERVLKPRRGLDRS